MTLSVRARRIYVAFVLAVGVPAGLIAATIPERAELAVGLAFLLVLVVSLFVSRPRPG
jgi:hypothetical protein